MTVVAAGTADVPATGYWRLTYTVIIGSLDGPVWRGKHISDVVPADTMELALLTLAATNDAAVQEKHQQPGITVFDRAERIDQARYELELRISEEARIPDPKVDWNRPDRKIVDDARDFEYRRTRLRAEYMIKEMEAKLDKRRFPPQDITS
jgi:hypothetical protein